MDNHKKFLQSNKNNNKKIKINKKSEIKRKN
jgi:hypothetical protein